MKLFRYRIEWKRERSWAPATFMYDSDYIDAPSLRDAAAKWHLTSGDKQIVAISYAGEANPSRPSSPP